MSFMFVRAEAEKFARLALKYLPKGSQLVSLEFSGSDGAFHYAYMLQDAVATFHLAPDAGREYDDALRPCFVANQALEAAGLPTVAMPVIRDGLETKQLDSSPAYDDLRRIKGIGAKVAEALVASGFTTYTSIANATEEQLREALASKGIRLAVTLPTWPKEAAKLSTSNQGG